MRKINRRAIMISIVITVLIFILKKHFKKDTTHLTEPSITLFRILGNDLPPLHSFNQTLTNLLFLLENEPSFPSVSKLWILNRIVNKDKEKILIDTLTQYKQYYLRIPFIWDDYRQIPFYFPKDYPKDEFFDSKEFKELTPLKKLTMIDILYYQKNLYAMNNNGARNFALRYGKHDTRSDWLMVFDGNCFLSQPSYDLIRQSLLTHGSRFKYFVVPMVRLVNNSEVHHINITEGREEPQVIFRRDSTIEYSETMHYGQKSKVELLVYLGVIENPPTLFPWLPKERTPIASVSNTKSHLFQRTSFILRLTSGSDPANAQSLYRRACSRFEGVISFLKSLDYEVTRRDPLPKLANSASPHCDLWSDEEIKKFVMTVRRPISIKV